jgi:hypothetical protein
MDITKNDVIGSFCDKKARVLLQLTGCLLREGNKAFSYCTNVAG